MQFPIHLVIKNPAHWLGFLSFFLSLFFVLWTNILKTRPFESLCSWYPPVTWDQHLDHCIGQEDKRTKDSSSCPYSWSSLLTMPVFAKRQENGDYSALVSLCSGKKERIKQWQFVLEFSSWLYDTGVGDDSLSNSFYFTLINILLGS